jgi:hypothetical protein
MTDHVQATGATMGSGLREQGMHALSGTTTCSPRSADGSSTDMLDRPSSQAVDAAAEVMHGPQGVECAWAQRAGAARGPCQAGLPPAFRTVFDRGSLTMARASACVRYGTTVLQPPMQTLDSNQGRA